MKRILLLATLLALALTVAACGGSDAGPTSIPPVPPDWAGKTMPANIDAAAGMEVYTMYCQACHGATGAGDGPAGHSLDPRPRNLSDLVSLVEDDYLFWRVNTGVMGTSMLAWGGVLTEEEIWQVVAYIRTLK